jgi:hypothetical protein
MVCLKQMEATVLGLKQLRSFIGKGSGQEMLDALIVEAEQTIAEIKRRVLHETKFMPIGVDCEFFAAPELGLVQHCS